MAMATGRQAGRHCALTVAVSLHLIHKMEAETGTDIQTDRDRNRKSLAFEPQNLPQ